MGHAHGPSARQDRPRPPDGKSRMTIAKMHMNRGKTHPRLACFEPARKHIVDAHGINFASRQRCKKAKVLKAGFEPRPMALRTLRATKTTSWRHSTSKWASVCSCRMVHGAPAGQLSMSPMSTKPAPMAPPTRTAVVSGGGVVSTGRHAQAASVFRSIWDSPTR